jgi:transposase
MAKYSAEMLVFVDESGCGSSAGHRRTGWSPIGIESCVFERLQSGDRWNILPAYSIDGLLAFDLYQANTDSQGFDHWIEHNLLPNCGQFPGPKSVVVMDNARFHHSPRIQALFDAAGVVLEYLPPYLPDLNPIEQYFGDLKGWLKRHREEFKEVRLFKGVLERGIIDLGADLARAIAYFTHSGWIRKEYWEEE